MIFIISIIVPSIILAWSIWKDILGLCITGVVLLLLPLIVLLTAYSGGMFGIPSETVVQENLKLSSVTTPSGNFYASSNHDSEGGRIINFTMKKEEDGQEWNEIRSVSGDKTKIFTNKNEEPYYLSEKRVNTTFLVVPWVQDIKYSDTYKFYIPEDSIIENYEIK